MPVHVLVIVPTFNNKEAVLSQGNIAGVLRLKFGLT